MQIKFSSDELEAYLRHLGDATKDMTPAMEAIAFLGEQESDEAFHSQTAPDGTPWTPSIEAELTGRKTLTKEANLRRSISSRVSEQSATWGTHMIYAAVHQEGATITAKDGKLRFPIAGGGFAQVNSVDIPARPYLPRTLEELDQNAIQEIFVQHLRGE